MYASNSVADRETFSLSFLHFNAARWLQPSLLFNSNCFSICLFAIRMRPGTLVQFTLAIIFDCIKPMELPMKKKIKHIFVKLYI